MTTESSRFTEILVTNTSTHVGLFRFLMSDQVHRRLPEVVESNISPKEYAEEIFYAHYALLKKHYCVPRLPTAPIDRQKGCADRLRMTAWRDHVAQHWAFEQTILAAAAYRVWDIRPRGGADVADLMSSLHPFLLYMDTELTDSLPYLGLCEIGTAILQLIRFHVDRFYTAEVPLLRRLAHSLGSIATDDWILYNPVWAFPASKREKRCSTLRSFLFVAITSYALTDDQIVQIYDLERSDILALMEDLIDLCESPDTTEDQIDAFIYHIDPLFCDIPQNIFYNAAFEQDFDVFASFHHHQFGNRYDSVSVIPLEEDLPDWEFLRSLGPDYEPEVLIKTDDTPARYVIRLFSEQKEAILNGPIKSRYREANIPFPSGPARENKWLDAFAKDIILQSIALRRYVQIFSGDVEQAGTRLANSAHILLVAQFTDPVGGSPLLGMSQIVPALDYHLAVNAGGFTEDEGAYIQDLSDSVDRLCLESPSKLPRKWKALFQSPILCQRIRQVFFSIIEALHLSPDQYGSNVPCDRPTYLQAIVQLAQYLRHPPDLDTLMAFLEAFPEPSRATLITLWDQSVWTQSFCTITDEREG